MYIKLFKLSKIELFSILIKITRYDLKDQSFFFRKLAKITANTSDINTLVYAIHIHRCTIMQFSYLICFQYCLVFYKNVVAIRFRQYITTWSLWRSESFRFRQFSFETMQLKLITIHNDRKSLFCWLSLNPRTVSCMGIVRPLAYLRPMNFFCTFKFNARLCHKIGCTTAQPLFSISMSEYANGPFHFW